MRWLLGLVLVVRMECRFPGSDSSDFAGVLGL